MRTESFRELREKAGLSLEQAAEYTGYRPRTVYRWENGETAPRAAVLTAMRQLARERHSTITGPEAFRFIDLFAGIGGMRKGFERAGGHCVFTCEWDESCRRTYLANFKCDHDIAGDIRDVPSEVIPSHDVLLAGFPCQPFSIAGVSKKNALGRPHGFACETQGTLFFDVARIIECHRPKAFVLENVKNLINHDRGKTFRVIRRTLEEELGYHIEYRVLDSRPFVPQRRERIFIVGFRDRTAFSFDTLRYPAREDWPRLGQILHPEDGSEQPEEPYTLGRRARVSTKYTLTDPLWKYLQCYAAKHRAKGNGFGYSCFGKLDVTRTLSARYYKDGSEILVSRGSKRNPRRLTPRECARLMGFDSTGSSSFQIPVSDTQAYKQFGNAVVVPVVETVAKAVVDQLHRNSTGRPSSSRISEKQRLLFKSTDV